MGHSYTPYTYPILSIHVYFPAAYKCHFTRPDVSPEKYVMMLGSTNPSANPA